MPLALFAAYKVYVSSRRATPLCDGLSFYMRYHGYYDAARIRRQHLSDQVSQCMSHVHNTCTRSHSILCCELVCKVLWHNSATIPGTASRNTSDRTCAWTSHCQHTTSDVCYNSLRKGMDIKAQRDLNHTLRLVLWQPVLWQPPAHAFAGVKYETQRTLND